MARLIRAHDWSPTPLGPPADWPVSLKTVVRIMLSTRHPVYIFWGADHRALYNDAYAESLGPEKHPAMLGQPGRDYWQEIWPLIFPQIDLVMRGDGATWHENQLVPIIRNGRLEDVYWTYGYSPIGDEGAPNNIGGVLVLCNEITEQVMSGQRDARNAARQLQLFEQAPGFICTLRGPHHEFEFVNAAYRRLVGERDYIGRKARDVVPDAVGQGFFELLDDVYASGERHVAHDVPITFQSFPDGAPVERVIDFIYVPTHDEVGNVTGIFVEGQDVTERHRATDALRASEERYRIMAEALPQLVWTCMPDGQCNYLSRQWTDYTGMAEYEQLGLDWLDRVIHPDDRQRTYDHWMGAVRGEHPYDIEYRIRRHDGAYYWFKTRGTPLLAADGNVESWFGTCTDITDVIEAREVLARAEAELENMVRDRTRQLEAAQEALRQSQKLEAMGQLTGGVAHDFNNLLTPILGNLDLLQRRGLGGEREARMIANALTSAERAKTLVQRLLAFARRQPLQPHAVDVGGLVAGMVDLIRSTIGPRVMLDVAIDVDLPPALADANQLEMALLNLAVNARDAMPDGGRLTIAARADKAHGHADGLPAGSYVCLSIADTGSGMDAATLARAIEPFFSTKGIGKGTGLGLSMVHGLASQLGGVLEISSEVGTGTQIALWLPVSVTPVAIAAKSEVAAQRPIVATTALLVEDEELVRMSAADMLVDLGYRVIEAASGDDALALVTAGAVFDLLITDHLMPGMTGVELIGEVRTVRPDVRALLVSGYADGAGLPPELPRLVKPFRKDELAQRLAAL